MLSQRESNDISPTKNPSLPIINDSSDEDSAPLQRNKKRVQRFSDSDTEKGNVQSNYIKTVQDDCVQNNSDSEPENRFPQKSGLTKSRIQLEGTSSDSDDAKRYETLTVKNEEQQMRMKNKRNKLKDKFKGLLSYRGKYTLQSSSDKQSLEVSNGEISDPSDTEMSSIAKIKQKIKTSMASISSICDPDTSDEESHMNKKQMPKQRHRNLQKSTKLIEPKPIRMSAKQAMENMQLIKSESNRMLREKAVSLPYHRPKALSLKDIMSRRKPAVSSDGKALPIKMNEEQLKQYALLLEQRQKEMMELCKSESDEETNEAEEKDDETCQESEKLLVINNIENDNNIIEKSSNTIECVENGTIIATNMDDANDVMYNELIRNNTVNINSAEVENTICDGDNIEKEIPLPDIDSNNQSDDKKDSNTDFKLVYNDSVEEENVTVVYTEGVSKEDGIENPIAENKHSENNSEQPVSKICSEPESQLISLHYTENNTEELKKPEKSNEIANESSEMIDVPKAVQQDDFFSDDDINMDDIDKIIENAEIMKDEDIMNSPMLFRDPLALNANPKIMGAPGMVIDLDGGAFVPKKLSGVELLKERFKYFSKLKTPEELERDKEKTLKPGAQHQKLKHELEEKIAEQRSLEWAKRLEDEKQQHMEMETILDDAEDSFEKIEANIDEKSEKEQESSSESEEEEELEENDVEIKDKPRRNNPMLDNEAEESDCDENEVDVEPTDNEHKEDVDEGDDNVEQEDSEGDESSEEEESSESEEEELTTTKKSRILKAFEDSDDEDNTVKQNETDTAAIDYEAINDVDAVLSSNEVPGFSQDDVIQLAQRLKSASDDLFTSQESSVVNDRNKDGNSATEEVLGTQTFSILDSTAGYNLDMEIKSPSKISALCMSQPYHDPNLNAIVDGSQLPITQSSQSQPIIGEDILALCTGKFYDNEFVSQTEEYQYVDGISQESLINNDIIDKQVELAADDKLSNVDNVHSTEENVDTIDTKTNDSNKKSSEDGNILNSILDELDDPEFDKPKPNKFFTGGNTQKKEMQVPENSQMKKKFIFDSDDEIDETNVEANQGKKKKIKKKRPEKRALQISDDEEEEDQLEQEEDEYMSDLEKDDERLVEYDSEENEIEVKPDIPKKKRKATEFFEQEAELTSEDEWVGSGDEDEKGLDRMEREAGDDEVFHQGKLRRELGQIHMRDVLDQDKREVRIIQELLFEDGDLGDGHRQRKFRWRNAGEEDETGTAVGEFADTQEEEFESEEQWRKQRHEREVFLRQMQQDEEEGLNISVNRTTIIKANLSSKSMSTLLQEVNPSKAEKAESLVVQEKRIVKDIPSPKKSFSIFQQNYHGSLLTRGRGALARLAALATPLAADDEAPNIGSLASHKRNFVFTALTPDDDEPKVTIKRKADVSLGTPKLVKKMKNEEKMVHRKSSLLDHFNL